MNIQRGLLFSHILWIAAWMAASIGAVLKGIALSQILALTLIAMIPAVMALFLSKNIRFEWAQMVLLMSWTGLAMIASFYFGLTAVGFVFLGAPLVAALFEKEKIIEAILLSTISVVGLFGLHLFGFVDAPIGGPSISTGIDHVGNSGLSFGNKIQIEFVTLASKMAGAAFLLGAIFSIAGRGPDHGHDHDSKGRVGRFDLGSANSTGAQLGNVLSLDQYGTILGISKQAGFLLGADPEQSVWGNLKDYITDSKGNKSFDGQLQFDDLDDALLAFSGGRDQGGANLVFPLKKISNTPSEKTTYLELDLIDRQSGKIMAVIKDRTEFITKVQNLEDAQILATKKSREKTLFFAGVSHELRTPLNAIIGFSDMMQSRLFGPLPGKYAEYAGLIHDSGQHMLDLIGDVLDISKLEAGKYDLHYDQFDAADVIRSSLKMVRPSADAAKIQLTANINVQDDLAIEADRRAVRQILLNLLSNAIKFTPKGGQVLVEAKIVGGVLNLSVEDNGLGMEAGELELLGKAFSQTANARKIDSRGTGLGLALVRNLVDLHQGRISFTSHPSKGTSVNVFLPVRRKL